MRREISAPGPHGNSHERPSEQVGQRHDDQVNTERIDEQPTQANTTLRLLVSAKTQTDAPVVEAVPGEAEPDFEPARTSRVAAAVAVTPLPASFRPARCSSPRLGDEATQGTRGQDMSGDTTLASEGDEMCQTDDPTYDPSDFSLDADFPLGATFSRYSRLCFYGY
ncbi:hypothetical protein HPB48_019620 [Haemaphysalis longicornis]|uniref:Uncharacterized protein n=1 Tax=Haemaphysalis longicornis TaxID=44386 RepID=A0A9J6GCT2_HAELO|nr:hypothetical protein HPB48_019620 [Haemaphysalis longicornis]